MKIGWKRGATFFAIFVLIAVSSYFVFLPEECLALECFQTSMSQCVSATYVNEESEASWGYEIKGKLRNECEIEVTLLNAKEGQLGIDEYEGHSMSCFYALGIVNSPEKNLGSCHGRLKEDLQKEIIEKLHGYVLENLDEIQEELRRV
jgi:hypothetical protein